MEVTHWKSPCGRDNGIIMALMQVAAAGKRMGQSDPDQSRPRPEKLPWCGSDVHLPVWPHRRGAVAPGSSQA